MRHYGHFGHHGGWGWVPFGITMVLLWLVLIAVLVLVWRAWSHRSVKPGPAAHWPPPAADQHRSPEQVLADRLARGEIEIDDYRQRLAELRGGAQPGPGAGPGTGPPPTG
ncbi:hypothetical protein GCM10009760_15500 [Kitasatospora kazusensis]|uniref:SHOCT domain-containing protein n=1 Tax=Kitasatospora kazusensis TaxID=407974 RepID=A0ABN2Z3G5_9ACTN